MSINSFPAYKHLLQENYVKYKHFFLPLFKLLSKILCHVFIVMLQLHNLLVSKMASMKEKAQRVLWCHETKSPVSVQWKFRNEYAQPPPDVKIINAWYSKFVENVSVGELNRSGRPSVCVETVDAVREAFQRTSGKSTYLASNELRVPKSKVVKILHKRLKLYAYKVQIVQTLQPDEGPRRASVATEILRRID